MSEITNTYIIVSDQVYRVNATVTKIGRSLGNHLVITSPTVSRQHAELHFKNGEFLLVDKESTYGTFHKSIKIQQCVINSGDTIMFADVPAVFACNIPNIEKWEEVSLHERNKLGPDNEPTLRDDVLVWR